MKENNGIYAERNNRNHVNVILGVELCVSKE